MSASTECNPSSPIDNLRIGTILEVDGTHIICEFDADITELTRIYEGEIYSIGQFGSIVRIHFGRKIIYGYVAKLRMKSDYEKERGFQVVAPSLARIIEADLFGEGEWFFSADVTPEKWELQFERGVSTFPLPQQKLYLTPKNELSRILGQSKGPTVLIGEHVGSAGTPCYADMNELLGKHTAVLGSTGSGKSGCVSAILHSILERGSRCSYQNWHPKIVILDPHNEYKQAFSDAIRYSTDEGNLLLPYWLLNLQECLNLYIGKTEFLATSQANVVKMALLSARKSGAAILRIDPTGINVDSPVPYSLEVFINEVNSLRPQGRDKKEQEPFNSVLNKLDVLRRDDRMSFIMKDWDGASDSFPEVVSQICGGLESVRIVDLSGVPNEVAGLASAAIARILFSIKVWQSPTERANYPVLLVCEEAHRYVPNRGEAQYEAAQEAIKRLAKEGRKYGIGLMLVSQRPSEVESTVLSQCNSWIVLRITNDSDREHVRAILPDSLSGLSKILSGLRKREAVFVGQAAMLPSRIIIRELTHNELPNSHDIDFNSGWQNACVSKEQLLEIGNKWRFQRK